MLDQEAFQGKQRYPHGGTEMRKGQQLAEKSLSKLWQLEGMQLFMMIFCSAVLLVVVVYFFLADVMGVNYKAPKAGKNAELATRIRVAI